MASPPGCMAQRPAAHAHGGATAQWQFPRRVEAPRGSGNEPSATEHLPHVNNAASNGYDAACMGDAAPAAASATATITVLMSTARNKRGRGNNTGASFDMGGILTEVKRCARGKALLVEGLEAGESHGDGEGDDQGLIRKEQVAASLGLPRVRVGCGHAGCLKSSLPSVFWGAAATSSHELPVFCHHVRWGNYQRFDQDILDDGLDAPPPSETSMEERYPWPPFTNPRMDDD